MMLLLPSLLGCQEPFGADRHDLRGFRIAALVADVQGDQVRPTAVVVQDGRLWGEQQPAFSWAFIDEPGDSVLEPDTLDVGSSPVLQRTTDRLALHVHDDDHSAWAELDLTDRSRFYPSLWVDRVTQLPMLDTPQVLTREARREWPVEQNPIIDSGGAARLTIENAPETALGRFMATGYGTFLELETHQADWFASSLTFEDELVTSSPIQSGTYSMLALAIDGSSSGFTVHDVIVGVPGPGVWVKGRFVPGVDAPPGRYWATLGLDNGASAGIRFDSLVPAEPDATWDPTDNGCSRPASASPTFDPTWFATGTCDRLVIGGTFLVEVE